MIEMSRQPSVRILPNIPPWLPGNADTLCAELEERLSGIDVRPVTYLLASDCNWLNAEVLITNRHVDRILRESDDLEWIQVLTAGVDGYPLEELREQNVILTSASGVHKEPVTEHVLGYILLFDRRLLDARAQQERKEWRRMSAREVHGNTLGVVGLGKIGQHIATVASALGMNVIGSKRTPEEIEGVTDVYPADDLEPILRQSDYLVLSCPLTDETRGLITRDEYKAMKDDAILINVSRGAVTPEDALVEALQHRRIRGAALDVFETEPLPAQSPLWTTENVVITPHNAGTTPQYLDRCAEIFAENYRCFAAGKLDEMRNRIL
jgi:phosphoglycerate dehydrogenase-like enzyme